jgi:hypothetical protein
MVGLSWLLRPLQAYEVPCPSQKRSSHSPNKVFLVHHDTSFMVPALGGEGGAVTIWLSWGEMGLEQGLVREQGNVH